jgi:hypothetical protein
MREAFSRDHLGLKGFSVSATIGGWLVALGSIGTLSALLMKKHAQKQHYWPTVAGEIVESRVDFTGEWFEPFIEYTYKYRERVFRNSKECSFLVAVNWRGPAQRWVDRYPVGAKVTVFVDPGNPHSAVLETGSDKKFLPLALTIAFAVIAVGVWLIVAAYKY